MNFKKLLNIAFALIIMMHQGKITYHFSGHKKKHLKVNDLLVLFDDLRKKDNIDVNVAGLIREVYV